MCTYQDVSTELMLEILAITKPVLTQNYYGFNARIYIQPKGLAMGSPSSSVLSELYIQHMEHTEATHTLTKPGIVAYFRYVDDILLIYNKHLVATQSRVPHDRGITTTVPYGRLDQSQIGLF